MINLFINKIIYLLKRIFIYKLTYKINKLKDLFLKTVNLFINKIILFIKKDILFINIHKKIIK